MCEQWSADSVPAESINVQTNATLRYQGQGMDITLSFPAQPRIGEALKQIESAFIARYRQLFGITLDDIPVELVSISVAARDSSDGGLAWKTAQPELQQTSKSPQNRSAEVATREIFDLPANARITYSVVDRASVTASPVPGPAVIAEPQTTTLVRPGWLVHQCNSGHLVMERCRT